MTRVAPAVGLSHTVQGYARSPPQQHQYYKVNMGMRSAFGAQGVVCDIANYSNESKKRESCQQVSQLSESLIKSRNTAQQMKQTTPLSSKKAAKDEAYLAVEDNPTWRHGNLMI